MADENDDDVPLLNEDDDDEELITADDERPMVETVFVVTFDVKHGNVIEFQAPDKEQLPLNGVEYKALPSGSHRINEDFVYFRHGPKYGLACLARADLTDEDDGSALSVVDQSQRGMRIKSVGILTSSIQQIQSYLMPLQTEATFYLHQSASNYDRLKELLVRSNPQMPLPPVNYDTLFSDFVQQFGPSIFPLARSILLGKRILLYSAPPIGALCTAVYFTHLLNLSVHALFFITVADLATLNSEPSYIACVTERIFKERTTLYDVFVDCDRTKAKPAIVFHTTDPILQSIVKVTSHDRRRFKTSLTLNDFMNTGHRFSQLLERLSISQIPQQINKDDLRALDLHPRSDRLFMNEYLRIHQLAHVTIGNPDSFPLSISPCCSCPTAN